MSTTVLQNPFNFGFADEVMPSAEKAAAPKPPASGAAATRFDRLFDPEKFLRDICIGLPVMSAAGFCAITGDDLPPLFLSDPSDDFIAAMHRDVLPVIEDAVRRGA